MPLRNFKLILACFFIIFFAASIYPQAEFERKLDLIPVYDGGGLIKNTFSGGHNNIEHQFIDLDGDVDADIVFLDSDQTFGWFKNNGPKYNPDFSFQLNLPGGLFLSDWFYFMDIDADNDFDYFTGNGDKISFYQNDGNSANPFFSLAQDTVLDNEGQPIYSEFGSNPIFVDIDADADFDFITGNSAGTLTFYQNIGTPRHFNLKFITNLWQNLVIIGTLSGSQRHGASSIDFADIDGDTDLDLFWGDFFSNSLYFIENQGTRANPDMKLVSNVYPINPDSVNTSGFNMPRLADIDNDGDYDLFVSVLYDPTVPQSLLYYENQGNSSSANHHLITQDYLKTLDVGNNSSPVFADIDNDNDPDLFLGSLNNPTGTIHFLENTGTNSNPSFLYMDSSFFSIENDLSSVPAFGDLDSDGDYDLLVGKLNGQIDLYINSGSAVSPNFTFADTLENKDGEVIDLGTSVSPFLIDVDSDQDLDLAAGAFNGKLFFYINTGSPQSYSFRRDTFYFASGSVLLDVGDNSTPVLFDYDKDNRIDLFSGSRDGKFYYWKNEGSNLFPQWNLITDLFIDNRFGGNTAPCFADVDNDSDPDLLLGNVKGGLYLYINTEISKVADWEIKPTADFSLHSFPNPFNSGCSVIVETNTDGKIKIEVFNILGEKVKTLYDGYLYPGSNKLFWDGKNDLGTELPTGVYLIVAGSRNYVTASKISLLK